MNHKVHTDETRKMTTTPTSDQLMNLIPETNDMIFDPKHHSMGETHKETIHL